MMSSTLRDLKQLLASADATSRQNILRELHEVIASTETSEDTARRIALYPLRATAARIGHDLKIFETLTRSGPKDLEELQHETNVHTATLGRLLKYMASVGLVREVGVGRFEASQTCLNLATPEAVTILTHFFDNGCPLFQEMPAFMRSRKYQDVTDGKDTVFQQAWRTDLDAYTWFSQNPEYRIAIIKYMKMEEVVRGCWVDEYPIEREAEGWDPNLPVFVDIGGNVGYYCSRFKTRFPKVPGRVILQDMPHMLAQALQTPGVEALAHDFFEPQPIRGAKFYHLGWVLHNWSDDKMKQILGYIRLAMTSQSVILINEMILPESGVPEFATSLDLVMLTAFGSRERTLEEWMKLLGDVGLVVKDCIIYNAERCHGIISAVLA